MNDFSNLPVSGGTLMMAAAYVAVAFVITGPLIAERSIKKLGWSHICKSDLRAEMSARKAPKGMIPKLDCNSVLGVWHPQFRQVCERHGNPDFGGPATAILTMQEKLRQEAEDRRLSYAASQSQSRCSCAATIVASDRIPWATYAGSMRLIAPPQIKNLQSELIRALHSPHCSRKG